MINIKMEAFLELKMGFKYKLHPFDLNRLPESGSSFECLLDELNDFNFRFDYCTEMMFFSAAVQK